MFLSNAIPCIKVPGALPASVTTSSPYFAVYLTTSSAFHAIALTASAE